MAFVTYGLLVDVALVAGGLLLLAYMYFRHRYRFWDNKHITHTNPSFPNGDFTGLGKSRSFGGILRDLHHQYKNERILGCWMIARPYVLVRDIELIKTILVKDFSHFHDRGLDVDLETNPLLGHLFLMRGQEWRNMRIKLTPTFTSGKMKMMFPTLLAVGDGLQKALDNAVDKGGVVDMKDCLSRFTTDVIGSCIFGIEVNSLENPDTEFRIISNEYFNPQLPTLFLSLVAVTMPKVASIMKIRIVPKRVATFFTNTVMTTIKGREEGNITRRDFMDLLIQLKNKGFIEDADAVRDGYSENPGPMQEFTAKDAAAQAFVFFIAGFETSSSTMQFTLYELAQQPDLQLQLQREIDAAKEKHGGVLTFEAIREMEFLDRVVSETLRKYPAAPAVLRECNKEYQVPGTDVVLERGQALAISLLGLHYDPDVYPNPSKYDPDRFLPEEKEKRDPFAYLPFGEGPRYCIGKRFALMQIKVGLSLVLSRYNVEVCDKTPIPIKFNLKVDFMTATDMHLRLSKRPSLRN